MIYVLDREEKIVGKGCFKKPSCPRSLKVGIVWERVNGYLP